MKKIKRLDVDTWMKKPKHFLEMRDRWKPCKSIFKSNGWYKIGKDKLIVVYNENHWYSENEKEIKQFDYTLDCLNAYLTLNNKHIQGLELIKKVGLATPKQLKLLANYQDYLYRIHLKRSVRKFMKER